MDAGEVNMKERIWISKMEYSVLKEKMKENECGWSKGLEDYTFWLHMTC
jgi:hypothetical protein